MQKKFKTRHSQSLKTAMVHPIFLDLHSNRGAIFFSEMANAIY